MRSGSLELSGEEVEVDQGKPLGSGIILSAPTFFAKARGSQTTASFSEGITGYGQSSVIAHR
ncbi:hypothetical protein [Tichowtungia aerotolerans]|uniref:Uncharacterized protein n=1 Tax=Tichowtungia aerotolerans TaxID=2697043 RepID=A0A6P1M450_9BACT|nr:hypothetical protein [Tichowtungia aerotolerans]QHI69380.1 hypothetical protein GT409_07915 [Tichowtungia aerotolerans]